MHGANVQNVCSRHCFCRLVLKNIYLVILYFLRRIITNHFGTMQLCNTINVHAVNYEKWSENMQHTPALFLEIIMFK